jgi:predicted Zn-dependent protease with MMP-like domain
MTESVPHLAPEEFDELVSEVIESLPSEWSQIFDKVTVVVEDEPSDDDLGIDDFDLEDSDLEDVEDVDGDEEDADDAVGSDDSEQLPLGRFRGFAQPISLLGGLTGTPPSSPPELALFQGPLERASSSLDELRQNIRQTLIEEIGHFFGVTQDDART